MDERRTILTKHASDTALDLDLDPEHIYKVVREGERTPDGRSKARYSLRTKKGLIVAICREYPDLIEVITVMRR